MVAHPISFTSTTMTRPGDTMTQAEDSPAQRKKKAELEDKPRGRRRSRAQNKVKEATGDDSDGPDNANDDDGHSSGPDGPSRKRRRSRKGLDKKFECPQEGCGKSYSRAEHLCVLPVFHLPHDSFERHAKFYKLSAPVEPYAETDIQL